MELMGGFWYPRPTKPSAKVQKDYAGESSSRG